MKNLAILPEWTLLNSSRSKRMLDIGGAVGLVAIATLFNLLAWPGGSNQDGHYFALVVAVLVTGLWRGLVPGLLATALAGLSSSYFILEPQFSIRIADAKATNRLVVFLVEGVLLSLAAHVIRNQRKLDVQGVGLRRYLAIPVAVGTATLPKFMFPELGRELPFAFNYAAVCACAWTGGRLSGVAATTLSAGLVKYLFLEPVYSLSVASQAESIRVGLFVVEGFLLTFLGSSRAKFIQLAANTYARARGYIAGALSTAQDSVAIRAISRDTIWEWGLDTGEIIRTPSWQDALSVALPEREEFESWVKRIHPEDRTDTLNRLQGAIDQGKEELQYSYRLLAPSGKFLSVWDHAFIIRGTDWKALRVIGRSAELPLSGVPER